jgi:hypothetical protein
MREKATKEPLGRFLGFGQLRAPMGMGISPVFAVPKVLKARS